MVQRPIINFTLLFSVFTNTHHHLIQTDFLNEGLMSLIFNSIIHRNIQQQLSAWSHFSKPHCHSTPTNKGATEFQIAYVIRINYLINDYDFCLQYRNMIWKRASWELYQIKPVLTWFWNIIKALVVLIFICFTFYIPSSSHHHFSCRKPRKCPQEPGQQWEDKHWGPK